MSAQLLELLLFAGVAFILINRLVTMLGATDEDDPARKGSIFGEPPIKDVSNNYASNNNRDTNFKNFNLEELDDIIVPENKENVIQSLNNISGLLVGFSPVKFIKSAKSAFKMIINALLENDAQTLSQLIDKRYLDQLFNSSNRYIHIKDTNNLSAKISDILMFGNSITIKIIFIKATLFQEQTIFKEEWTFQKSLLNQGLEWYLTNTEVIE